MKVKDLTPSLSIKSAEAELAPPFQSQQAVESLGGLSMLSNSMRRGYGAKTFAASDLGIWLGAADWGNAPFRVDMEGNLFASSATLSGYSKISVFKQASVPTSTAEGDIWVDTDDGNKMYRAASVGADAITAGEWESVDDARAVDAVQKSTDSTVSAVVTIKDSKILIDGSNGRIVINDGTTNRAVFGNV